jgi:hypothetical protein
MFAVLAAFAVFTAACDLGPAAFLDHDRDAVHTRCMSSQDARWSPEHEERLTPWLIHDLPRIAWIVEQRASELTDEERQIVRAAITRMLRALDPDTA